MPDALVSSPGSRRRGYARHRPEETLLYRLVAEHLETFLTETREKHDRALPTYVERELRAYLRCGILAHGFGRAECRVCHRQIVVAFSCKKRGLCPSCNARRMCNSAAHLTDRVLPDVPVRQTSGAWRIDWATLLKRVSDVDALACPCGGRLKFVEVVTEADRARQLLEQLGLDRSAPTVARARSPTFDFDPPPPDDW